MVFDRGFQGAAAPMTYVRTVLQVKIITGVVTSFVPDLEPQEGSPREAV